MMPVKSDIKANAQIIPITIPMIKSFTRMKQLTTLMNTKEGSVTTEK